MTDTQTGYVTSEDGTTIGYRRLGRGPGLVVLHGAMEHGLSHLHLAEALASGFTVYLPDRRGRGLSGPHRRDHGMRQEIADLSALLDESGAGNVFGVSSGALIALHAALALPAVRKVAAFEPPLSVNGSAPAGWLPRLDRELAAGRTAAALVTGMLGAQMGPPFLRYLPRRLLERLTTMMLARSANDEVPWGALAPTLRHDGALVVETSDSLERLKAISAEVLLLGGGKSPAYLKIALDALRGALPHARSVAFPRLGHGATGNTGQGGRPHLVAPELARFFA